MKKLILFDMDGTIYLGNQLFSFSNDVFKYLKSHDIHYVFLTNNSSKTKEEYLTKLTNMGVECSLDNLYTSTEATILYLKKNNIKKIFVLGVQSFKNEMKKHFQVIDNWKKGTKIDAVIAGFDPELIYSELQDACFFLQDGAKLYATNIDYRCPVEDGYFVPDCGGMCKWIQMCTNVKPIFIGKPEPEMIYQMIEKFNVTKEETLMVGDRYYTDIMAGINAGVDTLAVLTGEATKEELLKAHPQPTYVKDSIKNLIDILEK